MYDGIRHFLVVLPPLAILIGFTIWQIGLFWQKSAWKNYLFKVYFVLILAGYLQILFTDIQLHPYQIVYFNQLTGGIKGAYYQFDLDYWGQSLKEAAQWINQNLPTGSKINMPLHMEHHFPIDLNRFTFTDSNPDYKVNIIRGMLKNWDGEEPNYLYPQKNPIYSVNIDGADLLRIFKY